MVDAHMGMILMKDLNSSTWVIVHSFHRFLVLLSVSVITAALSRNLHVEKKNFYFFILLDYIISENRLMLEYLSNIKGMLLFDI